MQKLEIKHGYVIQPSGEEIQLTQFGKNKMAFDALQSIIGENLQIIDWGETHILIVNESAGDLNLPLNEKATKLLPEKFLNKNCLGLRGTVIYCPKNFI